MYQRGGPTDYLDADCIYICDTPSQSALQLHCDTPSQIDSRIELTNDRSDKRTVQTGCKRFRLISTQTQDSQAVVVANRSKLELVDVLSLQLCLDRAEVK